MTPEDREPTPLLLLRDFREHGAEKEALVVTRWGRAHVEIHLAVGNLKRQDTPAGGVLLLGSRGRRTLGLAPHYVSPPDVAASQVARRRARERLEAQGYRHLGKRGRNLLTLRAPDGSLSYLLAQWTPPRARSVRRVLEGLRAQLIRERGTLLVVTSKPYTLRRLEASSGGLVRVLAS